MTPSGRARARLERLHERLRTPSDDPDEREALEDEIFEALGEVEGTHEGDTSERAILLLWAIAPICASRPDLVPELLRYPARHLDAMGFAHAGPALQWIGAAPLASDERGSLWLLTELHRTAPLLQQHLDQLREGRESWLEPDRPPAPLVLASRLARQGRHAAARRIYEELAAQAGEPIFYRFEAARLGALEGERAPAERMLRDAGLFRVFRARLLALLGESDRAVAEIAMILQEAPHYAFHEEDDFASLRAHAGFRNLLRGRG
ncbi:MAG TPA: hypothetical protein VMK65_03940 [Longimicrobiales bacterium]|nr:hypothetical protein [Longimicrobiales bacterium]